uniref:glucan 1,3-beta-glucosidase n=1 Tax=Ganoderma boninense TaxID=34458 RepID=A0A5K1K2E0_9APHY|nr:V-type proton ATPase subunit H [Ganoderma boninense]
MSQTPYQPVFTNTNPYANQPEAPRDTQYYTPETEHLQLHDDLPPGAAVPRFMGAAAHHEHRASFASSNPTLAGEEYNPSTLGLNERGKQGFYSYNYNESDLNASQPHIPKESYGIPQDRPYAPKRASRKKALIIGSVVALVVIAGAAVAVYFAVIKPKQNKNGTSNNSSSASNHNNTSSPSSGNNNQNLAVQTGGAGSTVTMEDGTTFTYNNTFGGFWYYDPSNPFSSGARAQSWTPALNETFKFGEDQIRGVNLGGWLVTEPTAFDEWDLSVNMAADTANGGLQQLEDHYKTFITEQDFAQIAAAGLNFVRIPIPFWAIETRENEPFLPKTSWTYFLKAVAWARKYGLRINLDFHALPGSQNGWNHSGRLGTINVLLGPMGINNAERSLDYIRIISEFISQPEYQDVIVMFGITNEPFGPTIGQDAIQRYYVRAYDIVRTASGVGEGNGPWVVMHDAFMGLTNWAGFLPNADRLQLDIHQYICFGGQSADDYPARVQSGQACSTWASGQNNSMTAFGMTHVGEFSLAINDCGQWVNGVNLGARFDGTFTASQFPKTGDCGPYLNYPAYTDAEKAAMQQFALQSMSALQNWFFWTWKIGTSSVTGLVTAPAWSYQLGLEQGWMPKDPRLSDGVCENTDPFNPPLQAWQTGGAGAGQIPQSSLDALAWPPATLTDEAVLSTLPQYTQTGSLITLPGPSITSVSGASFSTGNGWANPTDSAQMFVPISSCGYLDPWMGPTASPAACPPLSRRKREAAPVAFPAPTTPPSPSRFA